MSLPGTRGPRLRGAATGALALGAVLTGLACGSPPNSLTGSLDEVAPLTFEGTSVRASPQTLVVEYDHFPQGQQQSGGTDIVFKLVVRPDGLTLAKGLTIDLAEILPDGNPRAVATRAVGTDPRRNLPPIKRGQLTLDADVTLGGNTKGSFYMLFGEGGQLGEGRTADGTFSAPVANAGSGGS